MLFPYIKIQKLKQVSGTFSNEIHAPKVKISPRGVFHRALAIMLCAEPRRPRGASALTNEHKPQHEASPRAERCARARRRTGTRAHPVCGPQTTHAGYAHGPQHSRCSNKEPPLPLPHSRRRLQRGCRAHRRGSLHPPPPPPTPTLNLRRQHSESSSTEHQPRRPLHRRGNGGHCSLTRPPPLGNAALWAHSLACTSVRVPRCTH